MLGQKIKREDGVKLMEEVRDRNRWRARRRHHSIVAINDAQRVRWKMLTYPLWYHSRRSMVENHEGC